MKIRSVSALAMTAALGFGLLTGPALADATPQKHNVIIFVADGLRSGIVNADNAPTLFDIKTRGVDFQNSHSVYPTVTTVNASAIAMGHHPGDTGEFGNNLYMGTPPLPSANPNLVADMEDDAVLTDANGRYGGNYLNEISLLNAARQAGFNTAAIGKEGPVLIQDLTASDGKSTIIIDDLTGHKGEGGVSITPEVTAAIKAAGLEAGAPSRGLNGSPGYYNLPGVIVPNKEQQDWFVAVASQVVLPKFRADGKPFVMVYWSRDPDGTQHNQGDSLNTLTPGINGPTSMAAIRNASDNLASLIAALKANGLYETTDIVVTADHGFATISKQSKTSPSASMVFPEDTVKGFLPLGFVAMDLARALGLKVFGANGLDVNLAGHFHPGGASILGPDAAHPYVIIVSGGGTDPIYLDPAQAKTLAPKIIAYLTTQDYTGGLFADDSLGELKGALKFSDLNLMGTSKTPRPAILLSFRSQSTGCDNPELCTAIVADTSLQQGQGQHGSFSRAETHNFMAAMGPDFKSGFVNPAPVSNADLAPTLAHLLGLDIAPKGSLTGRVITEALKEGPQSPEARPEVVRSTPAANGFVTVVERQRLGDLIYLDAGGKPGRVVGLKTRQ